MKKLIISIALVAALCGVVYSGTRTANLNMYKPDPGETGWGTLVNTDNWDLLDTIITLEHTATGTHLYSYELSLGNPAVTDYCLKSTTLGVRSWGACGTGEGGAMVYPGAGVPLSTGAAWGTSYTVGTGASNLVQLNAASQLPAVSGALLTNLPVPALAGGLTGAYVNWSATSGGSSILNKPTIGTAANNLLQLNASAQIPAVSGALLTNLPTQISDTAYNATSWDEVTTIAASKNAVRDYLESKMPDGVDGTYGMLMSGNTTTYTDCSSGKYGFNYIGGTLYQCLNGTNDIFAGAGDLIHSGSPAIRQWGVFVDASHIKGVAVTASKVACSDANGEPVACTNLTDVVPLTSSSTLANLASSTSANLSTLISDETGSGAAVFGTSPTIATPIITTNEVNGSASASLTAAQVSSTIIYNTGMGAADVALTLPTAASGYSALFTVGTAQANKWGVRAGTNDKIYLLAADGTIAAGSDNGYARMTAAQIGQSFACWTFSTGASAWDWQCKSISIGTSTFAAN